jgi:hypothetical protein
LDEDETERHLKRIKEFNLVLPIDDEGNSRTFNLWKAWSIWPQKYIEQDEKMDYYHLHPEFVEASHIFCYRAYMMSIYNNLFQPPIFPGRSICMALSIMLERLLVGASALGPTLFYIGISTVLTLFYVRPGCKVFASTSIDICRSHCFCVPIN